MCFSRFNTFYNIFSLHHNVTTEFNVTIDDVISDMVKCLSKLQKYFFQINIKYIKILFLFLSNINVNLLEFSHKMIKRVLAIYKQRHLSVHTTETQLHWNKEVIGGDFMDQPGIGCQSSHLLLEKKGKKENGCQQLGTFCTTFMILGNKNIFILSIELPFDYWGGKSYAFQFN